MTCAGRDSNPMVAEPIAPAPTPFHHSFELAVLQAQGLGRAENPMRPNRFRRCCPQHLGSAGGLCVPLANARNAGRPSACRRESQTVHWRPHMIFFTLSRKTAQKRAKLQGPPARAEPRGRSGPRSTTAPRRRAERGPPTRRARSSSLPPICAPAPAATYGANSRAGATRARRARPPRGGRQRRSRPASNRVRTRAAVVVGPRAHPRHFRPPRRTPQNARTESRPRGRGVGGMARDLGGTDPTLEVRHGEVRAHRGGNPGTRLLCPLPPAAADGHLIFFHAFLKNSAETRKTPPRRRRYTAPAEGVYHSEGGRWRARCTPTRPALCAQYWTLST